MFTYKKTFICHFRKAFQFREDTKTNNLHYKDELNIIDKYATIILYLFAEPPTDPLTCPIIPGKDTQVEINTDNKILGLFFIGGKDTIISVSV